MPRGIKAHLAARGHEVVTPTAALVRYWWNRCLREVFGFTPAPGLTPASIDVRRQHDAWAACHWPDGHNPRALHLTHHDEPISRYGLLSVITHELVHAVIAHEARDETPVHGDEFMRYAALVEEKTGFPLRRRYNHADLKTIGKQLGKRVRRATKGAK